MKDICIVTAYERPEMLHECLNRIKIAAGQIGIQTWVCIDQRVGHTYNREVARVAAEYQDDGMDVVIKICAPHQYSGNSYNTLEALKDAYQTGASFTFLVEDDVMVASDFFHWSYTVHALANFFASVAVKCTRRVVSTNSGPELVWVSGSDYASLAVCFPNNSLSYIVPHARHEYYSDMNGYVNKEFKNSRFSGEFAEQDGLIIRIMGYWNGLTAWPYVPRAFHAGYYGYHRLDSAKPMGDLEERIKDFKDIMFDEVALSVLNPNNADIIPCDLDGCEWSTLDINETFG
jgi:hypothetical protein